MAREDSYSILGVSRGVSEKEARSAFKKLAKVYHPDAGTPESSESSFKRLVEALEDVLSEESESKQNSQTSVFVPFETMLTGGLVKCGKMTVRVPAGCATGDVVMGTSEMKKVVLTVNVEQSDVFRRADRFNLETVTSVDLVTFVVGGSIEVPTPDGGSVRISVRAGSKPGSVFRVSGKGVTWRGVTGDLLVKTDTVMPAISPDMVSEVRRILVSS